MNQEHARARAAAAGSSAANPSLARVSRRSNACIIDVLIVIALTLTAISGLEILFGPAIQFYPGASDPGNTLSTDRGLIMLHAAVATIISGGYFVSTWRRFSASPGQLLLKLRVYRAPAGDALYLWQAALRWLLLFPPFGIAAAVAPALSVLVWALAPVWYLILLATTLLSSRRQGLHDFISHSIVLEPKQQGGNQAAMHTAAKHVR